VNIIDGVDVATDEGIGKMVAALKGVSIDILINNAGILANESLGSIDKNSIRQQFEVNALAPLLVTEALMGQFSAHAKLGIITSRMGSLADNTSGGRYGYRMSKAELNIAAVSLAQDLTPIGVAVAILHPGLVGTEMIGGYGDITPDQAAERLAQRLDELTLATSGTFWHSNGDVLPW
jgi:NAD(P)-dependent dehydrogenase (short-subunit alcohol dehydrogenase family)